MLAGPPLHLLDLGREQHLDALRLQDAPNLVRDVRVLALGQPRTTFDEVTRLPKRR